MPAWKDIACVCVRAHACRAQFIQSDVCMTDVGPTVNLVVTSEGVMVQFEAMFLCLAGGTDRLR